MDRAELQRMLDRDGINPIAYSLDGGLPPERYVLSEEPRGWSVYYSERGHETGRRDFETEDEACRYMLERLRREPWAAFHCVVGPLPPAEADAALEAWKAAHGLSGDDLDGDVRIDEPPTLDGRQRRYWVRGTRLPDR